MPKAVLSARHAVQPRFLVPPSRYFSTYIISSYSCYSPDEHERKEKQKIWFFCRNNRTRFRDIKWKLKVINTWWYSEQEKEDGDRCRGGEWILCISLLPPPSFAMPTRSAERAGIVNSIYQEARVIGLTSSLTIEMIVEFSKRGPHSASAVFSFHRCSSIEWFSTFDVPSKPVPIDFSPRNCEYLESNDRR